MLTMGGEQIPADPLAPLIASGGDGAPVILNVDQADVQLWSGVIGKPNGDWLPGQAEMLWPGSTVYASGTRSVGAAGDELTAHRIRIVGALQQERVQVEESPQLARSIAFGNAVSMVGNSQEEGVFLLTADGGLTELWSEAVEAHWVSGDDRAGMILSLPHSPTGRNGFIWVRTDGSGLRINAQPFFQVNGVAGDPFGGLWWIETPQTGVDLWQLWHWDPTMNEIVLRLQSDGAFFKSGGAQVGDALSPRLLAVKLAQDGDNTLVDLIVDTLDPVTQTGRKGLFRVTLETDVQGDGRSRLVGAPRLLLPPGVYQEPLSFNQDQSRLAYLFFDPNQASLTAGQITPPNTVRLLTLDGADVNSIRTLYQSENRFEFLAPILEWTNDGALLAARSRFAVTGTTGLDIFGAVRIPVVDVNVDSTPATSLLLGSGQQLTSLSACRIQSAPLLAISAQGGALDYAVWDGVQLPRAVFSVPPHLTRIFACWRTPE
jgi:hypothetical protein